MIFDKPELTKLALSVYRDTTKLLTGLFAEAIHSRPADRPDGRPGVARDDLSAIILGHVMACNEAIAQGFQIMEQGAIDIEGVSEFLKAHTLVTTTTSEPLIKELIDTAWRPETGDAPD